MSTGLIGKKLGMTQVFVEGGRVEPVTVVEAGPCTVTQVKTRSKDGYEAVQLGFGEAKRLNRAEAGHVKRTGRLSHLREFPARNIDELQIGQRLDVTLFNEGDIVDVTGRSKGHGFAGGVKRHNFGGGPKTHGQSDRFRAPGAVGAGTTPGKVFKGQRMAGHYGNERTTAQGLKIIRVDPERNLLLIRGAVPGPSKGLVYVRQSKKTLRKEG